MSSDRPSTVSPGTILLVISTVIAVALAAGFVYVNFIEPNL